MENVGDTKMLFYCANTDCGTSDTDNSIVKLWISKNKNQNVH